MPDNTTPTGSLYGVPLYSDAGGSTGGFDVNAIIKALMDAGLIGGGSSQGYAPPSFAETQAGIGYSFGLSQQAARTQHDYEMQTLREQARLAGLSAAEQRKFDLMMAEKQRAFELKMKADELLNQRHIAFSQTYGQDPVRAVLAGLGLTGFTGTGQGSFTLAPLAEAQAARKPLEQALSSLMGNQVAITGPARGGAVGPVGVSGLKSPEQAAKTYAFGGGNEKTLLTSAYGVGNQSLGGGLNADEFVRRLQAVTPTGVL